MATVLALASLLLAASCSKSRPAPNVEVSVIPASLDLAPGVQKQLVANVAGTADTGVEWKVDEAGGGTVTSNGLYTSPLKGGVYHVRATSHANSTRAGVAEMRVIISVPAILAFAARPASVVAGRPAWLHWEVAEATTLSIDQGVGSVSGTSVPVSPAATTTYTLTAANAVGKVTATATVTVTEGAFLPPTTATGDVTFAIDSGSASPISRYIYGINFAEQGGSGWSTKRGGGLWGTYLPAYTMNRFGGNRLTGHNWETGYSNCGNDCGASFPNDTNLLANIGASPGVGQSLRPRADFSLAAGSAFLLTAPIAGYVARDNSGSQPVPVAPSASTPATPNPAHWLKAVPHNPAGATATPNAGDAAVYTDDLAKWVVATYPQKDIQFELDNEPDIWFSTHQEIRGTTDGQPQGSTNAVPTGFDELIEKSVSHAAAIKSEAPQAMVWAGAIATWDGLVMLNYPRHTAPPSGYTYYFDYFLKGAKDAEAAAGRRLIDVFDVHWYAQDNNVANDYTAQTSAVIDAREQAPRSLWDPYFIENTWVSISVPSGDPMTQNCRSGSCPIQLIPRLKSRIAQYYPGTRLAIGEYYYGRAGDISGAIAQADVLGILGRTGVYAATLWPNSGIWSYNTPSGCNGNLLCTATAAYKCAFRAFDVYRNYDGAGAGFGDTSLAAVRTDPSITSPGTQNERVTAYASLDSANPDRLVIVAISKVQSGNLNAGFQVRHTAVLSKAEVWQVTGQNGGAGGCTAPARLADVAPAGNSFNLTLPPQSITVLVLKP